MQTPNDYSELSRVRDHEKGLLKQAFAEHCAPGDHCDSCTPYNRLCPHRNV